MLEGKKVRLRSVELSDLDEITKNWNSMELRNFVGTASLGPASRNEEEEWIRNTWKERRERIAYTFAIEKTSDTSHWNNFSVQLPFLCVEKKPKAW